ncbi:fructose-1,6-bisphosphatase/inositol monophosphatase family enzyme [Constrictibacter sp. MBR-5]|jgi:fructose-1,6-bisphosphatase/inositol monophosphatase family enzyme|uniref:inositol monophosphatase family protein n=1 Tax=Constrictibacter sp. MBR-5 TaxID=3156467 RepID=UPI003393EA93
MNFDAHKVEALVREVAAEEIVPRFARLGTGDVVEKSPGDLVTVADLASEKRFGAALPDLLPGSVVLGEEAVAKDAGLLSMLERDDPVWVVDPLDGTGNFSAGLPIFAVIVALVVKGRVKAGWIHDPLNGRMATALEGEGAWIDGHRVRVGRPDDLRKLNGAVYGRPFRFSEVYRGLWSGGRGRLGQVFNPRCVGQEYLARLQGGMHFGVYTRLNPWDHAAGCLLHAEAGGHVMRFDGTPYRPAARDPGIVVATDPALWDLLDRELVQPALGETRKSA